MNKKTKTLLTGVLSASLVTVAGCGANSAQQPAPVNNYTESDDVTYEEEFETDTESETLFEDECEVELDHLASKYPNVDLEAIEDYLEESGCTYNESELEEYIADIDQNGEPTITNNQYSSSFPWWMFLMNRSTGTTSSGFTNKTKTPTTNNSNVAPTKPNTKSSNITTSKPSSSNNSSFSSSSKSSSGFGSGSTSSGS